MGSSKRHSFSQVYRSLLQKLIPLTHPNDQQLISLLFSQYRFSLPLYVNNAEKSSLVPKCPLAHFFLTHVHSHTHRTWIKAELWGLDFLSMCVGGCYSCHQHHHLCWRRASAGAHGPVLLHMGWNAVPAPEGLSRFLTVTQVHICYWFVLWKTYLPLLLEYLPWIYIFP